MRLFQAAGFGQPYLTNFDLRNPTLNGSSSGDRKSMLLRDRYEATHILKPVYDEDPDCFFTVSDDPILQTSWAREHGLRSRSLSDILLAQIEEFQPDVFYHLDPIRFPSSLVRRLPGCVKKTIAWRAAPIGNTDLSAYDAVLSNFESLNSRWRGLGLNAIWFSPSWDPATTSYAANVVRPIDVFFTGSYARTTGHETRLTMLDAVAQLSDRYRIDLRLMHRNWGRLADKPWIRWIPVPIRVPQTLRNTGHPVYGREMYEVLSQAKILLNPATDIAGDIRGNIRCWEALGCGACMLGSTGRYPDGFEAGVNFETFIDRDDLVQKVKILLADEPRRLAMANAGTEMLRRMWSKERQWSDFKLMLASI